MLNIFILFITKKVPEKYFSTNKLFDSRKHYFSCELFIWNKYAEIKSSPRMPEGNN